MKASSANYAFPLQVVCSKGSGQGDYNVKEIPLFLRGLVGLWFVWFSFVLEGY